MLIAFQMQHYNKKKIPSHFCATLSYCSEIKFQQGLPQSLYILFSRGVKLSGLGRQCAYFPLIQGFEAKIQAVPSSPMVRPGTSSMIYINGLFTVFYRFEWKLFQQVNVA